MLRRFVLAGVALALVSGCVSGCGGTGKPQAPPETDPKVACAQQWKDVGETVSDLDLDPHPSAFGQRWASISAGVEYHRTNPDDECVTAIEEQVREISALRKFSTRLQPYDMAYQRDQSASAITLYLSDPLPKGVKGAPPKKQVARALATVEKYADKANAELQPAWNQASAVDLDDPASVRKAVTDLDRLAASSLSFQKCEQALQVLIRALRAQQGGS